jgi:membrane protein DedA with SNARE-associated domain
MAFDLFLGGTVVGAIIILLLYIWAYRSLSRKWKHMSDLWRAIYVILFFSTGPFAVLVLLALGMGTSTRNTDGYFSHSTVRPVYVEVVDV